MGDYERQGRQNHIYGEYVQGNTARVLRPVAFDNVSTDPDKSKRKERVRASHMNPAYICFLTIAMIVTGITCIHYLQLQSEVTNHIKSISTLESRLNDIKAENDDTESRIKGAVGLEDIKKRAMDELGMQYAREDQIVKYQSDDTDYVRQLMDITD